MLHLYVFIHATFTYASGRLGARLTQRGQATAEYALVLLGAAALALLIVSWATNSNKIGELFSAVLDRLKGHAER